MPDRPRRALVPLARREQLAPPAPPLTPLEIVRRRHRGAYVLHRHRAGCDEYRVQDRSGQAASAAAEHLAYADRCWGPTLLVLSDWCGTEAAAWAEAAAGLARQRGTDAR